VKLQEVEWFAARQPDIAQAARAADRKRLIARLEKFRRSVMAGLPAGQASGGDLEYLAGGDSIEDLLAEFPDLEREDILACLEFSRRMLATKSVHLTQQH